MRKLIIFLLFSLPGSALIAASVKDTRAASIPFPKLTVVSDPSGLPETNKKLFKNRIAKLRQTVFKKNHPAYSLPADKETRRWKKVFSVIALSLGALSFISVFTMGPAVLVLSGGAIVTGLISLENNKSKSHRFMALAGVLLGLSGIGFVYLLSTLF